ncbi:hypothetical protein VPNG_03515 [Cytospora leucostoma]|uniref:Pantothenate kinase n=1 Tax=Cytospora leucostoma TaxID=1230097 RepID=A0A423XD22_9PEZI|nr:hypothetical protein VPNG_03515 [Cytospora leucostoma]
MTTESAPPPPPPPDLSQSSDDATTTTTTTTTATTTTALPPAQDGSAPGEITGRPRTATTTAEIDSTIIHPGSVKINVKGAFIVEQESRSPGAHSFSGRSGSPDHHHQTKDIRLPNHTAVVSHIAVDSGVCLVIQIGGSLAKLVYFSREDFSTEPGGRLNFTSFETDRIDDCIAFMRHLKEEQQTLNGSHPKQLTVMATGGGAYKYYDKIREVLGVDVIREDEMECLIIGLDFFITEIPREVFTYSETDPMHFASPGENIYPYLLVNIGSGVSMLKVSGPREYQRVGGTSLGGGTLWGLLSLLTGAGTFDEMLDNAAQGDNANVDMLVGDIYGTDYGKIGLKSTTIASSFGKVFRMKREAEDEAEDMGGLSNGDVEHARRQREQQQQEQQQLQSETQTPQPQQQKPSNPSSSSSTTTATATTPRPQPPADTARFSSADVSRSLLYAISNNIGQLAFLQSQVHGLESIYFGGSFIRGHPQTMNTLSYAIKFWSGGAKQAYFLRHEGYLGSVGAFLKRQPRNWGRRGSFEEGGSLGLESRAAVLRGGDV